MKLLLIEDDPNTSELIAATLINHRYAVDAIADGATGLDLATQWSYDLILLDVLLPDLNGFEICRRLRNQGCQIPILMLTQKDSTEDIVAGLDAGADDYLVKSSDATQLLARVRALLRRVGNTPSSPVLTWGALCLDPAAAKVTYQQQAIALRPKEYALLELFLRYPQRIFNRSAIIDHLWSMEETPVEGSVTNLIKDLRQRLKSAGMKHDLIETVYGLGYRLNAPPLEETDEQWEDRQQRGQAKIQQLTERFQGSLAERLAALEAIEQSLQVGTLNLEQRKVAHSEAHKLAGGLGTFGCPEAAEVAQAIETLFEANVRQETHLANQLPQLLENLRRSLPRPQPLDSSRS